MLDHKVQQKLVRLKNDLCSLDSVLVAFSGGIDSSLLLHAAYETLGDNVLATIVSSDFMPKTEFAQAIKIAKKIGCKYQIVQFDVLKNKQIKANPMNRCYLCKKSMMSKLLKIAKKGKINNVIEGSNFDDLKNHRPGKQALIELGILSPLAKARLKKSEIRVILKDYGYEHWDSPSSSCLATRFSYGTELNNIDLEAVACAENLIKSFGFKQARVRKYNSIACLELEKKYIKKAVAVFNPPFVRKLKKLGFDRICLDVEGYTRGSMEVTRQ